MRHFNPTRIFLLALAMTVVFTSVDTVRGEEGCLRHDCSNDSMDLVEDRILGDEQFLWTAPITWRMDACEPDSIVSCVDESNRRCFEIGLYPEETVVERLCDSEATNIKTGRFTYRLPENAFSPYATGAEHHPRIGVSYYYVVRSCEGANCGEWGPKAADGSQDYIEIVGADYACFGSENGARCEKECYPGAPKMFSAIPDCANPF